VVAAGYTIDTTALALPLLTGQTYTLTAATVDVLGGGGRVGRRELLDGGVADAR